MRLGRRVGGLPDVAAPCVPMDVLVTMSRAGTRPCDLSFITAHGTGMAGVDHLVANGTPGFAVARLHKTITVMVRRDPVASAVKTSTVALSKTDVDAALSRKFSLGTAAC